MEEKKSRLKKKFIPLIVILAAIVIAGILTIIYITRSPEEQTQIKNKMGVIEENHNIYIIIKERDYNTNENDELTLYNGNGEVIETLTVTPKDKAFCVSYNDLEYKEVVTIHSKKLDKTCELYSIYDYDLDAYGTGEEGMSRQQKKNMNLCASIYYCGGGFEGPIEPDWGGESEYDLWKDGFITMDLSLTNYEDLSAEEKDTFFMSLLHDSDESTAIFGLWSARSLTLENSHSIIDISYNYWPAYISVTNTADKKRTFYLNEYLSSNHDFSITIDVQTGDMTIDE